MYIHYKTLQYLYCGAKLKSISTNRNSVFCFFFFAPQHSVALNWKMQRIFAIYLYLSHIQIHSLYQTYSFRYIAIFTIFFIIFFFYFCISFIFSYIPLYLVWQQERSKKCTQCSLNSSFGVYIIYSVIYWHFYLHIT
jgi:hypothetical protein